MLNRLVHGNSGPPLVIAHGLYGSARNWGVIAKRLSDRFRVITVDMRNHGDSFHDPDHSYAALAGDLARIIEAEGGRAHLLGHSMGGKAAMVIAQTRPDLLDHLIVADIAPVAYSHTQLPYIEAMMAVDLSVVTRRSEADQQLKDRVPEAPLRAFLLQSLELGADGPRWKLNLPALHDQMPEIMGFPPSGQPYHGPATVIRGASSDYVTGPHLEALQRVLPTAEIKTLERAGHWLHADDPRGFEAMVRAVLI